MKCREADGNIECDNSLHIYRNTLKRSSEREFTTEGSWAKNVPNVIGIEALKENHNYERGKTPKLSHLHVQWRTSIKIELSQFHVQWRTIM